MFSRLVKDLLYLYPLMKWVTKCSLSSLKVEMVLGVNVLNNTLASPLSVVGNALYMISSKTHCRCIKVMNIPRWLSESFGPLYASSCGIQNLAGKGRR